MEQVAVVSGADRGLGWAMCQGLLQQGWRVLAGQYMPQWEQLAELKERFGERLLLLPLDVGSETSTRRAAELAREQVGGVDLLINNAGIISKGFECGIRQGQDYADLAAQLNVNAVGALRMMEAFLPLLDRGSFKRLCFVSSEAGSIARCERTAWFGYCMSKVALNMGVRILFNDLRPQGYTFRLYHPGWIRSYMHGQKNLQAELEPEQAADAALAYFLNGLECEDVLALRDWSGREWPW